jgi:hypothetical protein
MTRQLSITLGLAFICILISIVILAKRDVSAAMASTPSATAELRSFSPSKTHGFYVTFQVKHNPEIHLAYWRLVPWRQVELSK